MTNCTMAGKPHPQIARAATLHSFFLQVLSQENMEVAIDDRCNVQTDEVEDAAASMWLG